MLSSSYKKVRSISEGNFHSCYASNKAEKFKFRRLSQGLESCAQAQALKLRKEEKELLKLYQNIEKEKEKNEYERRYNQYYLQMKKSPSGSKETNNTVGKKSSTRLTPHASSKRFVQLAPLDKRVKSLQNTQRVDSKGQLHQKKRRSSLPAQLDTSEVTPFYLQHSYTHYHYDPQYDHLLPDHADSSTSLYEADGSVKDQPCWKKNSKISRLRYRRNAITTVSSEHKAFLSRLDQQNNNNNNKLSETSLKSEKSNTLVQNNNSIHTATLFPSYSSNRLVLDFPTKSNELHQTTKTTAANASVLTPFERQGLAKHQYRSLKSMNNNNSQLMNDESERKGKHLFEIQKGRRYTIPSIASGSKLNMLKHLLMRRIGNGEDIKDLAQDEVFDGVLDIIDVDHICPAYDKDHDMSFKDFCALRKCKYLRTSKLNKDSLTEATLGLLINEGQ